MRHFTHTQKALDKVAKIVCKEKQAEVKALKEHIKNNRKEGCAFANKYFQLLFSDAHDLYDFLMSL